MNENIDDFSGDAVGSNIYEVKSNTYCFKCGRNLKGKIAYLVPNKGGKLFNCYDISNSGFDATICVVLQAIKEKLELRKMKLTMLSTKKIDKVLKDQLE